VRWSGNPALTPFSSIFAAADDAYYNGDLVDNYLYSLARVAVGFGAGAAIGLTLGLLLGVFRTFDLVFGPLLTAMRQVPIFGLIPLLGLWFGIGEQAKIVLISLAAFYPVVLNTHEGLKGVPREYREVATVLVFSRAQLLRRVIVPCALPAILTGLKHGLSFAWIAVVAAELFLAAAPGLGNILEAGREQFRLDTVLLGVVLIGGTGAVMNHVVTLLERRALRWRPAFA
jgi:sulfonate transport system permease protein